MATSEQRDAHLYRSIKTWPAAAVAIVAELLPLNKNVKHTSRSCQINSIRA